MKEGIKSKSSEEFKSLTLLSWYVLPRTIIKKKNIIIYSNKQSVDKFFKIIIYFLNKDFIENQLCKKIKLKILILKENK